jgi:LysR family nitrogen assimilation transcriptional regulator
MSMTDHGIALAHWPRKDDVWNHVISWYYHLVSQLRDHLQKVRALTVIVQLGSFRKAAARLHVSQPALSQSIQSLEGVVGRPLLVRTRRGVTPTEAGLLVCGFADKLTVDLETLDRQLEAAAGPMSGQVRIGTFETLAISLFPGFVAHAYERFPKLAVSITSADVDELAEMLLDRRLQLVVSTKPRALAASHRALIREEVFRDRYRFFASRSSQPANKEARSPLILVPEALDDDGRQILDYVAPAAARRRATIELSTFDVVRAFTLQGIGVGVLPALAARADVAAGRLREVDVAHGPRGGFGEHAVVVQRHERDRSDPKLTRLVDELRRYAARVHLREA